MRWLHLSDIHFNPNNDGSTTDHMRDRLPLYIEQLGEFDEVFITGDFRNAKEQNINAIDEDSKHSADYILSKIAAKAGVTDINHIHLVPGNHDLNRKYHLRSYIVDAIKAKYNVQDGRFDDDILQDLLGAFDFYYKILAELVKSTGIEFCGTSPNLSPHIWKVCDGCNILCLNTALLCGRDGEEGTLLTGNKYVLDLLTKIGSTNNQPTIVLAHHSMNQLERSEMRKLQQYFRDYGVNLYLCGHAHELWVHRMDDVYEITTGCIKYDDGIMAGFTTGEYNKCNGEFTIEAHIWDQQNSRWGVYPQFAEGGELIINTTASRQVGPEMKVLDRANDWHARHINALKTLCNNDGKLGYIKRTISINGTQGCDLFDALIQQKHMLLIGEMGIGKTNLAYSVTKRFIDDARTENILPIFMPAVEYGTLYETIIDGIISKLDHSGKSITRQEVISLMNSAGLALIFDGIDEIRDMKIRERCIADIRNICAYSQKCFILATCKVSEYHSMFPTMVQAKVEPLTSGQITSIFVENGIRRLVTRDMYEFFSNPFMLSIGVEIYKHSGYSQSLKRSTLIKEYVHQVLTGHDEFKGIRRLNYADEIRVFSVLGNFSVNAVYTNGYSVDELYKALKTDFGEKEEARTLIDMFRDTIFTYSDGKAIWRHGLLFMFFKAYYYAKNAQRANNLELSSILSGANEPNEVIIMFCEMTPSNSREDVLDSIMMTNLKLYVDCINSINDDDLKPDLEKMKQIQHWLNIVAKTYNQIIQRYFKPVEYGMPPIVGRCEYSYVDKEVQLVAVLSEDQNVASIQFIRVDPGEPKVRVMSETDAHAYYEMAIRNRSKYTVWTRRVIENGKIKNPRIVAVDIIKSGINDLLKERQLYETDYLKCERINEIKKRFKETKDSTNLYEIRDNIANMIRKVQDAAYGGTISYNGVDLNDYHAFVDELVKRNVSLDNCLLPGGDIDIPDENSESVMWLFTKSRYEERVKKFFYYAYISYKFMVSTNFPNLSDLMDGIHDMPYKDIIYVDYTKNGTSNCHKATLGHYHSACKQGDPEEPVIKYGKIDISTDYDSIAREIISSYERIGKRPRGVGLSQTGGSCVIYSRSGIERMPLCEFVYEWIKKDIVKILGVL